LRLCGRANHLHVLAAEFPNNETTEKLKTENAEGGQLSHDHHVRPKHLTENKIAFETFAFDGNITTHELS
jgi:hypothetical protein